MSRMLRYSASHRPSLPSETLMVRCVFSANISEVLAGLRNRSQLRFHLSLLLPMEVAAISSRASLGFHEPIVCMLAAGAFGNLQRVAHAPYCEFLRKVNYLSLQSVGKPTAL